MAYFVSLWLDVCSVHNGRRCGVLVQVDAQVEISPSEIRDAGSVKCTKYSLRQ